MISIFNNKAKLKTVLKNSSSFSDVLNTYNMNISGANVKTLKYYLSLFNLSTEHFKKSQKEKIIKNYLLKKRGDINNIYNSNSKVCRGILKKDIIKNNLIKYECQKCKNDGVWMGKKLTLEIEHINADRYDNRIENLTFLCPNCHSQTESWRYKNKKNY